MNADCRSFQRLLELTLSGLDTRPLSELTWHEHLLACADCRRVLEAEEALEMLLASLPQPRLPSELAARVVNRLRKALSQERLDVLLELDATDPAPANLAAGLLTKLAAARGFSETSRGSASLRSTANEASAPRTAEVLDARLPAEILDARLDVLLDRARDVAVPDGLADRVLAGLRFSRRTARTSGISPWLYAVAAALVLALGVAWTMRTHRVERAPQVAAGIERGVDGSASHEQSSSGNSQRDAQPEPELLAALDVLEQWDLLLHDDVDVLLSTLEPSEVDALDESTDDPVPSSDPLPPPTSEPQPKSKG